MMIMTNYSLYSIGVNGRVILPDFPPSITHVCVVCVVGVSTCGDRK